MRTQNDLRKLQALPLELKIRLTKQRIQQWVAEFGEDGVYVSFSGGKDSTVLLHIIRQDYPNIPAVFVNTGLEYPEIVQFVKTVDNVIIIRPEMNFKKVIEKYGYPFISKEISQCVYECQKPKSEGKDISNYAQYKRLLGQYSNNGYMDMKKWGFLLEAPFWLSHKCCSVMKKRPMHKFAKENNRVPMTAEMASESKRRTTTWLMHGCNMFDTSSPKSTPMAFWTEQDVLQYIRDNDIRIASVYGDIVVDEIESKTPQGQLLFSCDGEIQEAPCSLKTTGCRRTGCMFCGFGCHLESGEGRFVMMKRTHPKLYEWIMKSKEDGGLDYKNVIDWLNEHGKLNIRY